MENHSIGNFCASVLLAEDAWDKQKLLQDLKEEWAIDFPVEQTEENSDTIITDTGGLRIVISKFPAPVPDQEAEISAENNFMWPEAVKITSTHKAHILVAIFPTEASTEGENIIDHGLTFTKIVASCTQQKNAIGVYTSGVVFEPHFYYDKAQSIKDGTLPVFNWIWFGLYETDNGISAYTYGLNTFGKHELEIIDAQKDTYEVYSFIAQIAYYILEDNIVLQDGETIGFSKSDKHTITLSKGIALPEQDTIKIGSAE